MRQVIFDLETTGLAYEEGHRIVEIGAVELIRGAVTGRTFHTYVNPERGVPEGARQVHGLTERFLRDYPAFADARVGKAFLDFVGDAELIAHNGMAFDLPFINAELTRAGLPTLANDIVDTLIVARRKFPGSPVSLDALCARFGVDTTKRDSNGHGALLDSRLLAAVYIELTGGAQAGLDFAKPETAAAAAPAAIRSFVRFRPVPLAPLLTAAEAALHAEFVARELGPRSRWLLTGAPSGV